MRWIAPGGNISSIPQSVGLALLMAIIPISIAAPNGHVKNGEQAKEVVQPANPLAKPVQLAQPITERPPEPVQPLAKVEEPKPQPAKAAPVQISGNAAMQFIFQKESSNNPYAKNASGCLGLGQACPGSKLLAVCPDLGNVQCQINFFTAYANSRYGGWEGAYQFWIRNHWW